MAGGTHPPPRLQEKRLPSRAGAPSFQRRRAHSLDNPQPGPLPARPVGKQPPPAPPSTEAN